MRVIEGDLIALAAEGQFDVIVHGCNCFHTMGAGIAKVIAERFPEALQADKSTAHGAREKLGSFSSIKVQAGAHDFVLVNAYTQHHYHGPVPRVDYDAVSRCFRAIAKAFPARRIGYPLIGAGLAGGDWQEIAPRIDAALAGQDHALVILPGTTVPGSIS